VSRPAPAWLASAAAWLTPRRIHAHALVLAVCLWGVCAVDFSTPGLFDRAGNIKFQDFLSFYISGRLITQGRAAELYDDNARNPEMLAIVPSHVATDAFVRRDVANVRLPYLYGPQFALIFAPISRLPFLIAAQIWVILNLILYAVCIYLIWSSCPALTPHLGTILLVAVAFPPLFHFFVRGQNSVLALAFLTVAFLALQARNDWLAGVALGFLIFKPQFLVAIPLVFLLSHAWRPLAGLVLSAAAQLAVTRIYFGQAVMQAYFATILHTSRWLNSAEVPLAPIQMHSLRSFWLLLIPWPQAAFALYILSCILILWIASAIWKSSSPLALRFSALTLAAVLINPHLFVYDLLVLAPVLLLLVDWTLANAHHPAAPALRLSLYLAFILPLLGPLTQWTHLQLSVPVFVALLWILRREAVLPFATAGHKLDSTESHVV
jgi:hypothetical protein